MKELINEPQSVQKKIQDLYDEDNNKIFKLVKKWWEIFHRYFFFSALSVAIGVWIGVTISKNFYSNKMEESLLSQAFVYKGKAYSIMLK